MATRTPTLSYAAGINAYLRIFNQSGQWFDFNDSTFKTSGTGTTPFRAATYDTVEKIYRANSPIDFSTVWNKGLPTDFLLLWYNNVTPATGDSPITDGNLLTLQFGEFGPNDVVCRMGAAMLTSQGLEVRFAAWLERSGQRVALAAGSCTVTVREQGSGVDLFTVTDASISADYKFELVKTTPGFTNDRLYVVKVEITENGTTWTTYHDLSVFG
jgi:hypothetical protein